MPCSHKHHIIMLLVLIATPLSAAVCLAGPVGSTKCYEFLNVYDVMSGDENQQIHNQFMSVGYMNWVSGFLDGYLSFAENANKDISKNMNLGDIMSWVKARCMGHIDERLQEVIYYFIHSR